MKKIFFFTFLLSLSFLSCKRNNGFVISANITGFPDSTMFLLENVETGEMLDTTYIVNNKFEFKGKLNTEPQQLDIYSFSNNSFSSCYLFIGNERVTITGDKNDFPRELKISGSKYQDEQNKMNKFSEKYANKSDSLRKIYYQIPDSIRHTKGAELREQIKLNDSLEEQKTIYYIKNNIDSYASLFSIVFYLDKIPRDTLKKMYNELSPKMKKYKYAKSLKTYIDFKSPQIGDKAYNFTAFDKNGKEHNLFEIKTPYILLDFTAFGCGACSYSAPYLRVLDSIYKDSLTVVSLNLNLSKDKWKMSIKYDTITWLTLWNGEGTLTGTAIKYNIRAVPTFFILDKNKRILDKFSMFGENTFINKLDKIILHK